MPWLWRAAACGARFCTGCGAPSAGPVGDADASQSQDAPAGSSAQSAGFAAAPGYPQEFDPYPQSAAGYHIAGPGYVGQVAGYPTAPTGYPTGGYPVPPPTQAAGASDAKRMGWLIGGVVAATLAVAGIGVGIYLAVDGGSSGQTRLLSTPSVGVTPASAKQASSAGPPKTTVHTVGSTVHLPPSVSVPTTAPVRHTFTQEGETRAVADTIQRHFSLISEHDFSAAYALLAQACSPENQLGWHPTEKTGSIVSKWRWTQMSSRATRRRRRSST